MTRQAAEAGANVPSLPILNEHESENTVGLLLVTGDRGLAGAFNSQILRAGTRAAREHEAEGRSVQWYASGRRGVSSLSFRGLEVAGAYVGFTERPNFPDARQIAQDLMTAYIDEKVDRVEIFYNGYISPLVQEVRRETVLPLQQASILGEDEDGEDGGAEEGDGEEKAGGAVGGSAPAREEILKRLVPDYVEIST